MPSIAVLALLLLTAACAPEPPREGVPSSRERAARGAAGAGAATLRFDPLVISPGERVGSLTVREVHVSPSIVDGQPVGWVRFTGEIEMSGRVAPHPEGSGLELCFFPDRESASRLPRMLHDERTVWLCFANHVQAREALGFEEGRATLVLDDYRTVAERGEVVDSGRLVRVLAAVPLEDGEAEETLEAPAG
jgi:hypothetical protein